MRLFIIIFRKEEDEIKYKNTNKVLFWIVKWFLQLIYYLKYANNKWQFYFVN